MISITSTRRNFLKITSTSSGNCFLKKNGGVRAVKGR
jgi:hypothetical protein